MLRGYYTAASGILTKQREIDTIGNNLVNINTSGYKADTLLTGAFEKELALRMQNGEIDKIGGPAHTSAIVSSVETNFNSGMMKTSDRPLDVALDGEGFFLISNNDEMYLTRAGEFDLDDEGFLVLPGFGRVQNSAGDIYLGTGDVRINSLGEIYGEDGTRLSNINIVKVQDEVVPKKADNGLFQVGEGEYNFDNAGTQIMQYVIEGSNVDANYEMTTLIETQRMFQSCSAALQIVDELNQKAVSSLGALN